METEPPSIELGNTAISQVNDANGAQIEVIDLCYGLSKGKTQLLHNVNLLIKPGDMVALMGPSGAGKSTLLDLIANRKIYGEVSGKVFVNGKTWSKSFHRETAYCLQDDMHFSILTVEETIRYAAWTRMPRGTSAQAMEERVNLLITMMGLSHVRKTLVGGSHVKGISGGQMKRLSIAVEIISLPSLIFLGKLICLFHHFIYFLTHSFVPTDEPTSGLDSAIALEVMQAVRKLADGGTTIVATIHQPSNESFALFNKVEIYRYLNHIHII
jgi:ABC-type multidrug transport system ATPase subunit